MICISLAELAKGAQRMAQVVLLSDTEPLFLCNRTAMGRDSLNLVSEIHT